MRHELNYRKCTEGVGTWAVWGNLADASCVGVKPIEICYIFTKVCYFPTLQNMTLPVQVTINNNQIPMQKRDRYHLL